MSNSKRRVNLMLDGDVIEMLDTLAEGERKRGQYISSLIRSAYAARGAAPDIRIMNLEGLRLLVQDALTRQCRELSDRVFSD